MKADWKYNRKELVTRVIALAAITTAICFFARRREAKSAE
jgi:hypothetical protein